MICNVLVFVTLKLFERIILDMRSGVLPRKTKEKLMSDLTKKLYELSQEDLDRISGGPSLDEILKEFGIIFHRSRAHFLPDISN